MIYDEDLVSIMESEIDSFQETYSLEFLQIISGTDAVPTATVKIKKVENGKETLTLESALGDGAVDAAYKAIDKATGLKIKLTDYTIRALTSGGSAMGEVVVNVSMNGKKVFGHGGSTDVVEASALAYVNGINKLVEKTD